jgi:hypothetical protein
MPGLIVLALLAGVLGVVFASQATMGVAFVGFGCLCAILARLRQADIHHHALHDAPPAVWALFPTKPPTGPGLHDGQRLPWTTTQKVAVAVLVAIFAGAAYVGLVLGHA